MGSSGDRRRLALLALLVLLLLAAGLLLLSGKTPEGEAGFTFEISYRDLPFLEVVYEQAPFPLDDQPPDVEGPAVPLPGYVHRPEAEKLIPSSGRREPIAGDWCLGRKLLFRRLRDDRQASYLDGVAGPEAAWAVGDETPPEVAGELGAPCRLRLSPIVTARREGKSFLVSCGGEEIRLGSGETAEVWRGEREFDLGEYVSAVRALSPGLAELDEAGLAQARLHFFADAKDRVRIHGRIVAVHRGTVSLADADLANMRDDAEDAARRGEYRRAEVLLVQYLCFRDRDGYALEALRRVRDFDRREVRMARLTGRVTRPDPPTGDDGPVLISVRHVADPPRRQRAVVPVVDGRYEVFVPEGDYEVRASAPGVPDLVERVSLSGEAEWDVAFHAAEGGR